MLRASPYLKRIGAAHVRVLPWIRLPLLSPAVAGCLLLILAACGEGEDTRVPLDGQEDGEAARVQDLPPEIRTSMDSANAAYRVGNYEEALEHFTEVTRRAPGFAAGWYGISMTQSALGQDAAADSAMMRVHELAPEAPMEHPDVQAPPNPHPVRPAPGDSASLTPR